MVINLGPLAIESYFIRKVKTMRLYVTMAKRIAIWDDFRRFFYLLN